MEPVPNFTHLRYCARPMVFLTGVPETPFSVACTGFVVGFRGGLFVLTASHVVHNWPSEQLRLIVSDKGDFVTFRNRWVIRVEEEEECGDQNDLLIFHADIRNESAEARRDNHVIHLTPPSISDWFNTRRESMFFLFGYPKIANGADYENSKVISSQYLLHGVFVGDSLSFGCYEISVENPLQLATFDGLSGSPVFSLFTGTAPSAQPTFCGIAIRGTASSLRVHILGSQTILEALDQVAAA